VLEDTTLLYLSRPQPDTEHEGMLAAEVERLRRAILELPEEQRRVLLLAAFQGRTSREISEREGIPLGTAKTRLRAAMLRLRAALGVTNE
jgi:RNA polymerase sigma factor (sigma-70 family)